MSRYCICQLYSFLEFSKFLSILMFNNHPLGGCIKVDHYKSWSGKKVKVKQFDLNVHSFAKVAMLHDGIQPYLHNLIWQNFYFTSVLSQWGWFDDDAVDDVDEDDDDDDEVDDDNDDKEDVDEDDDDDGDDDNGWPWLTVKERRLTRSTHWQGWSGPAPHPITIKKTQ